MFGLFDAVTDTVTNVLDVGEGFLDGELPSKQQVAKLVAAGVSIYAISEATGIAEDVVKSLLDKG
jgi:hypothetical protein